MQQKKQTCVARNQRRPQKARKASENSTSCLKSWLPGTLLMVLAMCSEQSAASTHTKMMVAMVGIMPDRLNVAGRLSMAGPVRELTAIDMDPSIPMEPVRAQQTGVRKCTSLNPLNLAARVPTGVSLNQETQSLRQAPKGLHGLTKRIFRSAIVNRPVTVAARRTLSQQSCRFVHLHVVALHGINHCRFLLESWRRFPSSVNVTLLWRGRF